MPDGTQPDSQWPIGTTEMHARVRAHDWAATPLGPIADWPPCLKSAVDVMMGTGFPALLLWGEHLIQICNDAYRLLCRRGAPIGVGFGESWPEGWPFNQPVFEQVWRGETVVVPEAPFFEWRPGTADDDWYSLSYSPVRDELGKVAGIWISLIETTERVRAEATLRENEARLEQLLALLPVGVTWFDTDRKVIRRNPEMQRLLALPANGRLTNQPIRMFDDEGRELEEEELPAFRALRGEIAFPGKDLLVEAQDKKRWIKAAAVPFIRDGQITGGLSVAHDITEAKKSAEHMKMLVAELQHRTRNLIGVVRALADKTLQGSASLADFRARYCVRLSALARVQGLLSHLAEGERVAFDQLLRAELIAHAALDGGQVTLEGPEGVRLRSGSVQTLALALHELATNATKFGALAHPKGSLAVRWRVDATGASGRRELHVEWQESGVPMPAPDAAPQGGGYGRELIERVLPYQLSARTTFELGTDGVRCTIVLQIASDVTAPQAETD